MFLDQKKLGRGGQLTHNTVPSGRVGVVADDGGIALLEVLLARGLDTHLGVAGGLGTGV